MTRCIKESDPEIFYCDFPDLFVVCDKTLRPRLHGRCRVDRIWSAEFVDRAQFGGSYRNCGRQGDDLQIGKMGNNMHDLLGALGFS
jgi:hypothetical protein